MGVGAMAIATSSDIARMEATLTSLHDQLENTESKIIRVEEKLDETSRQLTEATNELSRVVGQIQGRAP